MTKNTKTYQISVKQVNNGFTLEVNRYPSYDATTTIHPTLDSLFSALHELLDETKHNFLALEAPAIEVD